MLYLEDPDTQVKIDSAYVFGRKFQFKGKVDYPKRLYVMEKFIGGDKPVYTSFWVENSDISIVGKKDEFRYVKVMGSKPQDVADILNSRTYKLDKRMMSLSDSLRQKYQSGASKEEIDLLRQELGEIRDSMKKISIDFIKEYPNSYVGIEYMYFMKDDINKDTLQMLFDNLQPKFKNSAYAEPVAIYLNSKLVDEGDKYVDFEAKTIDGKTIKFSDFVNDKYVLLDFWGSGCGPCRFSNRHMAKNFEEVSKYLEVVSFSTDKNMDNLKKAVEEDKMQWNVVTDLKGMEGAVPIQYQVRGIPTFFLISSDGKIVKKQVGFSPESFEEILDIAKE